MTLIVCTNGNNPYFNNPQATENEPREETTHQGKLYTKFSYDVRLNIMTRLVKITEFIALSILTCFIALAFEKVRKLCTDSVNGIEQATVLRPYININISALSGQRMSLNVPREWKIAKILPLIEQQFGNQPQDIKLLFENKVASPFNNIDEVVSNDKNDANFAKMSYGFESWTKKALNHPSILLQAFSEIGHGVDAPLALKTGFSSLYENAVTDAINS